MAVDRFAPRGDDPVQHQEGDAGDEQDVGDIEDPGVVELRAVDEVSHVVADGFEVGQGDEVITAPNSFIATAEAISICGAVPVFVDVDDQTYNLDPALIEAAITPRTKAIARASSSGDLARTGP